MNCTFTICAKNYLAQALTLKASFKKHEPNLDFFIFLADSTNGLDSSLEIVALSEEWIPNWREMAYKYDVIEFNTSIKPFCFNKLFIDGYEKVIYLDPDIYVTKPLTPILDALDNKSIVLTPHYCEIQEKFSGAVSESTFNCDGIFNLGFCAIKNNNIGREIINWWQDRLYSQCYSDRSAGLFVDQKWMDYLPGFFPNDIFVLKDLGANVAIWNLHERLLFITNTGEYKIRSKKTQKEYSLLFFHFSGFDPFDNTVINRRHPQFNIKTYPSFIPIIEEYRKLVYDNKYDIFSKMKYSFNTYSDGTIITPLQRRLYRIYIKEHNFMFDPFEVGNDFYMLLKKKNLLLSRKSKQNGFSAYTTNDKNKGKKIEEKFIKPALKILLNVVGPEKFAMIIRFFALAGEKEYYTFLLK